MRLPSSPWDTLSWIDLLSCIICAWIQGHDWLAEGMFTRYQALLVDTLDITLKVCQTLHPLTLFPVAKSGDLLHQCEMLWRRKWQPTPVFLPGESHGQRSLVGYSPWGCRVRHDWAHKHRDRRTNLLQQVWSSRWASWQPWDEWFAGKSNFVEMKTWQAKYAVVRLDGVIEAKALPPRISAKKAELTALMSFATALQLGKKRKLNIFIDSIQVPRATLSYCHLEREILTARNSPMKHKDLVLAHLQTVQLPTR